MIKIALTITLLAVGSLSAQAQTSPTYGDGIVKNSDRIDAANDALNKHSAAIKTIKQQLASNQAPAGAKIDYARYDRASRDCSGVGTWVPNPATKEHDVDAFNRQTDDGFKQFIRDCMSKRTTEDFAADARRAQKRDQRVVQLAPPAPGVIQDEEPVVSTADLQDGRDALAPVEQASYGRRPYGRGEGRCHPGFHFDPREQMCTRHTEVDGPSPYDQRVDYCQPGTTRLIEARSPNGGRRMVEQTCNRH